MNQGLKDLIFTRDQGFNMSANEKTSKPPPIGITGLNFSKRITAKHAIFRKSGRLPKLIYLRLCGIRVLKKIHIISLKSVHSIFKPYLNLHLRLLLSSWNLNKTGLFQAAEQRSNLSLRLLYFLHNERESSIIPVASPVNTIVPPTSLGSIIRIIKKGKALHNINLHPKIFTFLRSPLGDMWLIDNLNTIRQASHYKSKISPSAQTDRLEISSDQAQGFTPMTNPREVSLKLQTKRSGEFSRISDKPFPAPKGQQLPVEIISMGGLFPLPFMRKRGSQSRPVDTQEDTWRFSDLDADSQGDMPNNKMRLFTPSRSSGGTTMNLRVTREENEDARSGFSGENAFFGMASSLKKPVSSINITSTNPILKNVIKQDPDILSKDKKGIEKTTSTKINHITNNLINLIHKKTITQNTDTAQENQKTLLETEKTISRRIINKDFVTETIKERPIKGINMIADRVYKIIEKRIAIEKDRRGMF